MNKGIDNRFQQIGFNRRIRFEWMEYTANLALTENDNNTIKSILMDYLSSEFPNSDKKVRGAISKTITILMKTWVNVPKELEPLKNTGLTLLKETPQKNHMLFHWGMVTAVYPFWAIAGAYVGRLLRLQGSVPAAQIQRRVKEKYGERETVSRCARYLLRSYIDWGVLKDSPQKGVYNQGKLFNVDNDKLIAWLIEAQLNSILEKKAPLRTLLETPSLFPFQISSISSDQLLKYSDRLDVVRHGLDDELIVIKS